jgi:hypothetical protein
MNEQIFKDRTKRLGLATIRMIERLPRTRTADVIGRQVIRSGTSMGRQLSRRMPWKDRQRTSLPKLRIVEEEADETSTG